MSQTLRHDTEFAFEFMVICGATLISEVKQLYLHISLFSFLHLTSSKSRDFLFSFTLIFHRSPYIIHGSGEET